jgi:hypothetical protein
MELFYRLGLDTGLVILILSSIIIGSLLISNFWIGLIGLQSLSVVSIKTLGFFAVIFMVIPSFFPVFISSYLYGNLAHNLNHEFNYADTALVSAFCFFGIFVFMGRDTISWEIESIDTSLTPAVIITLLVMSGLILSCYLNVNSG